MAETKIFEIRDYGTFIVGVATNLTTADPDDPDNNEGYLLGLVGFKKDVIYPVLLYIPTMKTAKADYNAWADKRTIPTTHKYITEHWNELKTGDLIDVRVILGEAEEPCESERVQWLNWLTDHPEIQLPTS